MFHFLFRATGQTTRVIQYSRTVVRHELKVHEMNRMMMTRRRRSPLLPDGLTERLQFHLKAPLPLLLLILVFPSCHDAQLNEGRLWFLFNPETFTAPPYTPVNCSWAYNGDFPHGTVPTGLCLLLYYVVEHFDNSQKFKRQTQTKHKSFGCTKSCAVRLRRIENF